MKLDRSICATAPLHLVIGMVGLTLTGRDFLDDCTAGIPDLDN